MRPSSRVLRRTGVALAATLGLVAAPVGAAAATTPALDYVNMGDSYSAASGVLPLAAGSNPLCTQSAKNWAHDIAGSGGYDLSDVSCGGAKTKDFTSSQFPGVAPQLAALSPATDLVTMTIGGNDNNTFIEAILACGSAAVVTAGRGSPCEDTYGDTFAKTITDSTYPNLVNALDEVKAKAPNARIAISGYLRILPDSKGCYPFVPIASGDVPYLNGIQETLNGAVERAAAATGATYVDESAISAGHDACQPIGTRWVEPVFGSTNYVPVHPNALGEQAMANRTITVLGLG